MSNFIPGGSFEAGAVHAMCTRALAAAFSGGEKERQSNKTPERKWLHLGVSAVRGGGGGTATCVLLVGAHLPILCGFLCAYAW